MWKCLKDSRILACAPSNSAADLLCQRLIKDFAPRHIYRLMASSRNFQEVPADIRVGSCTSILAPHSPSVLVALERAGSHQTAVFQPCCNWDNRLSCYVYPSKKDLGCYRIIVTTLVTAGRSEELGLSPPPTLGGPHSHL